MIGSDFRERSLLETRHPTNSASTQRPRLDVPDDVAQESDFWKFVGTVAIPATAVALLAFVIGFVPRIALHLDPAASIQPSAGGSLVFDIPRERLQALMRGSLGRESPITETLPTEQTPVEPFLVEPPLDVPVEFPPPVTVERDEPPGRLEPDPLPTDRAESVPSKPEVSEPDADPNDLPREMAAIPESVPSTPEPAMPEPPTPEPSVEARPTEPPASPEPTLQAPVESQPSPEQPLSLRPERPVEVEPEPPTLEPSVPARPIEPPASPEPAPRSPVATQSGPAQPVSPRPEPPVLVERDPPPVEVVPVLPPAGSQTTPASRSESPAAELPPVAMIPPMPADPLDQLLPPGRGSGHKLLARLAATESIEGCESRGLPFFRVIESNVIPARLPPGGRFSHRLVYALCPAGPDSQPTATVTRELRGGGEVVLTDRADSFRLRPGTWASDEELAVPPNTDPGRYTVNTTVTFGGRVWTEQTDLLIE